MSLSMPKSISGPQKPALLQARFNVSLPGLPRDAAQDVIEAAHQICPYSKMS
jgi:organic hydroperoxide reductase OsmC/OhrA